MKKIYILLMVAVMVFTLVACGGNNVASQKDEVTEQTNIEIAEEMTKEAEEADLLTLDQVTWEHLTQKTLPEETSWLKETDQVSLVAAIEEKNIYLYCLNNGHPWGGQGVILQCGEMFQTYPLWCLVKYGYPVLGSCDMDADGTEELLFITGRSGGTGLYIEDLYVFEPDGDGYTCVALETTQIATLINEQVSFDWLDDSTLQACQTGAETDMLAAKNETMLTDHISLDVEADAVTLSTSVQVINEDGQWKYLCDYLDDQAIDKEKCAAAEYIYTVEAEVVYDGQEFSLVNLHFEETERVQ